MVGLAHVAASPARTPTRPSGLTPPPSSPKVGSPSVARAYDSAASCRRRDHAIGVGSPGSQAAACCGGRLCAHAPSGIGVLACAHLRGGTPGVSTMWGRAGGRRADRGSAREQPDACAPQDARVPEGVRVAGATRCAGEMRGRTNTRDYTGWAICAGRMVRCGFWRGVGPRRGPGPATQRVSSGSRGVVRRACSCEWIYGRCADRALGSSSRSSHR